MPVMGEIALLRNDQLEIGAFASLAFGIVGDAMGTPTENLEPEAIHAKFGWVETFEGDGTDDSIMRNLIADALLATDGYADADSWASEWMRQHKEIFGQKVGRFFPSVLHSAAKLRYGDTPRTIATGNMPSSSSAMAIAPVGIVNAGHPRAAAAQAMELASLIHVTDVAFCQDGAAAIAAAVSAALGGAKTIDEVVKTGLDAIKPWSGRDMRQLIETALELARSANDYFGFRTGYHQRFRRAIACDSRETIPATLAICLLAGGDPWKAVTYGANFGRDADTIACMAGYVCGAFSRDEKKVTDALKGLPASIVERERSLAVKLVALARQKARNEIKNWQPLAG
jgi:ADP-ribosylglycohydrolase